MNLASCLRILLPTVVRIPLNFYKSSSRFWVIGIVDASKNFFIVGSSFPSSAPSISKQIPALISDTVGVSSSGKCSYCFKGRHTANVMNNERSFVQGQLSFPAQLPYHVGSNSSSHSHKFQCRKRIEACGLFLITGSLINALIIPYRYLLSSTPAGYCEFVWMPLWLPTTYQFTFSRTSVRYSEFV